MEERNFNLLHLSNRYHKRYEPIWLLMHKIRIQMGERDKQYQLDQFKELDKAFFAGHRKVGLNIASKSVKLLPGCLLQSAMLKRNSKGYIIM